MGARERMAVEQMDVRVGGAEWASRGAAVGARERLPVGQGHAHSGEKEG